MPRCHIVMPCAGTGQRALDARDPRQADCAKQYQVLAGQPMVMHTLLALTRVDVVRASAGTAAPGHVLAVTSPDDVDWDKRIAPHLGQLSVDLFQSITAAPIGGDTRAHSVLNGLSHLLSDTGGSEDDWVLVHDAARCLVNSQAIEALIAACLVQKRGGLLAQPLADTLKLEQVNAKGIVSVATTVDRSGKWLAQTPQMFPLGALRKALQNARENPQDWASITDEASAMERLGVSPILVAGGADNFKVTYPTDFAMAEALLRARSDTAS